MHKSKFLALLLAVAMVVSMVVVPVYAADEYTIKLTTDEAGSQTSVTAAAGETVDIYLSTSGNNPGVISVGAAITYPEGWSISGQIVESNLLAGVADVQKNHGVRTENPYTMNWLMPTGTFEEQLVTTVGNLAKITFQIPNDAEAGTYNFGLSTEGQANQTCDTAGGYLAYSNPRTVDIVAVGCTVEVAAPETPYACPEHTAVTEWDEVAENTWTGGELTEGHYKLAGNQKLTSELTVAEGVEVCVDLNGFNIQGGGKKGDFRVFNNSGTLTICDSAETDGKIYDGGFTQSTTAGDANGMNGGNILNNADSTFNLYGGVISGGYIGSGNAGCTGMNGGNIFGEAGSVINIKGGTVENGEVTTGSYKASVDSLNGGNIATKGSLYISGGTITNGGTSISVTNPDGNRPISIFGGNVAMMSGSGELKITGGTISNGHLTARRTTTGETAYAGEINVYGGNIYVNGAQSVQIKNATITGGSLSATASNLYGGYNTNSAGAISSYQHGATVYARGGSVYIAGTNATITDSTISDGSITIDATGAAHKDSTKLPVVAYGQGGSVYFEGSGKNLTVDGATMISGGDISVTAKTSPNHGNTKAIDPESRGGNLYVKTSATAEIKNNVVISAGVTDTAPNKEDSKGQYGGYALGGNVYVGGTVTITDNAQVKDGKTDYRGGNIGMSGSTLNLKGNAKVTKGALWDAEAGNITTTSACGANIFGSSTSTLNAYDNVVVSDGVTYTGSTVGLDAYLFTSSTINQYGGNLGYADTRNTGAMTIYNGVAISTSSPTIAGCAKYTKKGNLYNVFQPNLDANGLCATCGITYSYPNACTHSYTDNTTEWECSVCGETMAYRTNVACKAGHTVEKWIPWDGVTKTAGHYYLTDDMTLGGAVTIGSGVQFCLDLNGHTLTTATNARAFINNAGVLTIMSSVEGGAIQAKGHAADAGAVIKSYTANNKLYLYNITVNGGRVEGAEGWGQWGGNIYVSAGTFHFEDCTISNGYNNRHRGGNLGFSASTGTLKNCDVFGGDISDVPAGGTGLRGGNMAYDGAGSIVIDGGTWTASDDYTVHYGGNIYATGGMNAAGTLTIQGGAKLIGGKAENGGNIGMVYGYIVLNDCTISDGNAVKDENKEGGNGGNIYVGASGTSYASLIIHEGAVIENGSAAGAGDDVYVQDTCVISAEKAELGNTVINTSSANATIGTGVTATGNLSVGVSNSVGVMAADGTYNTYADLATALTNAGDDAVVTVGKDDSVATLNVTGKTLDLNGKTVTASQVVAATEGTQIIDSKGTGLLKCDEETLSLVKTNGYLPIWDEANQGFRLEAVELEQRKVSDTKIKFRLTAEAEETVLEELIKNGDEVTLEINVTWDGGSLSVPAKYPADLLKEYVGEDGANWGMYMFTCTVTGAEELTNVQIFASINNKNVTIDAKDTTPTE